MLFRHRYHIWWRWSSSIHYLHFFRCPEHLINLQRQVRQAKLFVASRLDDYIVIDCSFIHEYKGSDISLRNYYEKLQLKIHSCFTSLYRYHSPSFIILCNIFSNNNDKWLQTSPYCHVTSLSYLDLFPREQLVYLSPDSPNIMTEYEHNVIYILGGIFEKTKHEHLTLEKAEHEHIRHQSLPLQKYLKFSTSANPVLSLNQVYNILMTLKHNNNNWFEALKCIPERCLLR
ncbi:unnamed protein product [Rotaria magnacalcarata]|uniref:SAM-dependent MTase TRM10-type domain-containing protein n=1 Tax=Rotaria magnacalcarata TaxID=392030 RepID=A0A816XIR9_9BILA|nr:unnamed protein product [Rotaria magnacalcarata]CAF1626321.1 unnamed protein product [Rotaria magnacalcarata]CAF2066373.1 unnamed protein product [Rotaria magnacalcarata]CAF2145893.1 unnamed protein product [Rotaria magnacalcarata]CAF2161004.1 unnamed protein product [Rotaria magnacalcarata]